ncbi:uncharacterized protein LOC129715372 isoform X1 [Leucoraja erinacea]|uniref:uncharacterized protein LOC129715372 isoform X1 n=1 Tax=Leucoraja erinaceus TaxID=7782 RepID=UPI002453F9B9|nr:uncharacterized protein LOC129715372 isoform X1 [Leucoraja erinacea]
MCVNDLLGCVDDPLPSLLVQSERVRGCCTLGATVRQEVSTFVHPPACWVGPSDGCSDHCQQLRKAALECVQCRWFPEVNINSTPFSPQVTDMEQAKDTGTATEMTTSTAMEMVRFQLISQTFPDSCATSNLAQLATSKLMYLKES